MGVFDSIKKGLEEAIAFADGKNPDVLIYQPKFVNVKTVREKTGLSQRSFADAFGISVGTLRHWEQGDRKPHGPGLVLLNLLEKSPDEIRALLVADEGYEQARTNKINNQHLFSRSPVNVAAARQHPVWA